MTLRFCDQCCTRRLDVATYAVDYLAEQSSPPHTWNPRFQRQARGLLTVAHLCLDCARRRGYLRLPEGTKCDLCGHLAEERIFGINCCPIHSAEQSKPIRLAILEDKKRLQEIR
jgi:hypothetical protein